ncbi:MAG TPA: LacI family DNA-binding transcriptional regulator [Ktedonobacteraceae bacterium]|nr:LacI family DNA-binding transcriptional regulator [Ktedonobacteraceae bacterium]
MAKAEQRVLLRDVAKHAGVAISTASNVFAGKADISISEQTRALVLAAAKELGYQPKQRPVTPIETVGLVVRAQALPFSDSPFYAQILHGAEQTCTTRKVALMYATVDERASVLEQLPLMIQRKQVQALLLAGYFDPTFYELVERTGLPFILIDHMVKDLQADSVTGDDEEGGFLATRYLLEHGHRHPALITGPVRHTSLLGRLNGYRRALAEYGVPYDDSLVYRVDDTTLEEGYAAMQVLLDLPVPPTGVFCCNDHSAMGALRALYDQGVPVPDGCSIIGYDDIKGAAHTHPPLTTIKIDQELLGVQSVWLLLERIERPDMPPRQVRVGVSLVERGSVKTVVGQ